MTAGETRGMKHVFGEEPRRRRHSLRRLRGFSVITYPQPPAAPGVIIVTTLIISPKPEVKQCQFRKENRDNFGIYFLYH